MLKSKPLPAITKADIVAVMDRLADRPAVARAAYAVLRKMFAWAEGRGEIDRSPIGRGFPAPRAVKARDRVLDDDEIVLAWGAADILGYPFGPAYRLLFATGARREEVAAMEWSELDRGSKEWTLPPDRAKNHQAHIVPLSDISIEILDEIAMVGVAEGADLKWPKSGLVFTTNGETPVSGHSKAKKRLDAAMAEAEVERAKREGTSPRPIPPWRTHDIRRTVATGLQKLGVRFEVTEAVLNHVSGAKGGVAGVYQRHNWKEEKRAALDAWARHVGAIGVIPSENNIVKFQTRAQA